MYKMILINCERQEIRVAVVEDKKIEEFYVERTDQERLVGNIYKGKVTSILPGMDAAFVDLGLNKNGFLHINDVIERPLEIEEIISEPLEGGLVRKKEKSSLPQISSLLKKGQELIVQVVKEPIGTKGARLTTHITIPGRYLVLMPYENHIGISKRITDHSERVMIKKELSCLRLPKGYGFIVRTAASGCKKKVFASEVKYLIRVWERIKKMAETTKSPILLCQELDLVLRIVRDLFTNDINRLIVDSKDDYKKIIHFVSSVTPYLKKRVKYYRGETPLFEHFGIESEIAKIYERKVRLKNNKGYIVIEQTEGLTAIDVNTGKFVGSKDLEETAFQTNLEAAREISRQLRLRDLGGIIVIDFIDMELKGHREQVFEVLKETLRRDKAKTKVLNISPLGLVEMTRQRMRKSIETISYIPCPYCGGRGAIKSVATVCIELRRMLSQMLSKLSRKKRLVLYVHPEVHRHLLTEDKGSISHLENRYKRKIIIEKDPSLHIEQYKTEII